MDCCRKRHPSGCRADDVCAKFETENMRFDYKRLALHQCRVKEDEVWLKAQRDPAAKQLAEADKRQDGYISAARYKRK